MRVRTHACAHVCRVGARAPARERGYFHLVEVFVFFDAPFLPIQPLPALTNVPHQIL